MGPWYHNVRGTITMQAGRRRWLKRSLMNGLENRPIVTIFFAHIVCLGPDLIKRKEFMTHWNNLLIYNLTTANVGYGDSQG